jgi:molybdenum cofactor cytidylyltransferase
MSVPVGVIVLAAGDSRRMTGSRKLWRPLDGKPMLVRTLENIAAAGVDALAVVVKPTDAAAARAFAGDVEAAEIVVNGRYATGMHSSIQAGIAHLRRIRPGLAGFMICLADQPLLTATDYQTLLEAFAAASGQRLICPRFGDRRGNPVLIPAAFAAMVLAYDGGDRGCFYLLRDFPELVSEVDMANDAVLFDVDTNHDFAVLMARLEGRADAPRSVHVDEH